MAPQTVITIGTITSLTGVMFWIWKIYCYIGRLENKVENNRNDTNRLGNSVGQKDKSIISYVNNHCLDLGTIEYFLEKKF
ncbi:hypothetical protein [Okeania sp. SIO2C2]|uniref:hypothetical protein n=1 Tax=Okeania sp. SIO2C2 TaxID=2607787 RepID=UPI00257C240A|nr:hypothetical protein [Okeania sp. SIO2C2]